jgi:heat shock protein HtpX
MALRNTLKTAALLGGIGGLLVLAGSMIGGMSGAVIGLVLGIAIVGASYWFSDRLAIRAAGAHPVSEQEAPTLHAMVTELAAAAALPKPRVFVSPAPQPNAFATGISFVANMALFAGMFGGGDEDDGPSPVAALPVAVLAPIAATILQMALSRSREFEADRVGAQLLGDPRPLAHALQRIDTMASRTPLDVTPGQASAYIVNPLAGRRTTWPDPS